MNARGIDAEAAKEVKAAAGFINEAAKSIRDGNAEFGIAAMQSLKEMMQDFRWIAKNVGSEAATAFRDSILFLRASIDNLSADNKRALGDLANSFVALGESFERGSVNFGSEATTMFVKVFEAPVKAYVVSYVFFGIAGVIPIMERVTKHVVWTEALRLDSLVFERSSAKYWFLAASAATTSAIIYNRIRMLLAKNDMGLRLLQLEHLTSRFRNDGFITGMVTAYAGANAPTGWILCDGRTLDPLLRPEEARLYQLLQDTFDITGGRAVCVPDLRGRTVVGAGQGKALSERNLGHYYGKEMQKLTRNEMPRHNHSGNTRVESNTHSHEEVSVADCNPGIGPGERQTHNHDITNGQGKPYPTGCNTLPNRENHTHEIPEEGDENPFELSQPSLVLNYIVKL